MRTMGANEEKIVVLNFPYPQVVMPLSFLHLSSRGIDNVRSTAILGGSDIFV
jgi:hypothetical protein